MRNFQIYNSVEDWRLAIEDPALLGLFVNNTRQLLLDRRYAQESDAFRLVGPRTIDMNLIGPDKVVVPGDVAFSYIAEAIQLRNEAQTKIGGGWSL